MKRKPKAKTAHTPPIKPLPPYQEPLPSIEPPHQRYPSFGHLMLDVVERGQPEATILAVAAKTRLSDSTVLKWLHRRTKSPAPVLVKRLCRYYPWIGRYRDVMRLIYQDSMKDALGKPVPKPDLSGIRPGPRPRHLRRLALVALAATATLGGLAHETNGATTMAGLKQADQRHSVKFCRRRRYDRRHRKPYPLSGQAA